MNELELTIKEPTFEDVAHMPMIAIEDGPPAYWGAYFDKSNPHHVSFGEFWCDVTGTDGAIYRVFSTKAKMENPLSPPLAELKFHVSLGGVSRTIDSTTVASTNDEEMAVSFLADVKRGLCNYVSTGAAA